MKTSFIELIQKLNSHGSLLRTVIYTIGHMCIAVCCLMAIANVPFSVALTDAIVEPILNGFWYYILDRYWASSVTSSA